MRNAELSSLSVELWREPATMDTGSPEPLIVREGDTAWVAYLCFDPAFPGWDAPSVVEYLEANPGEPFGVLRFDGVTTVTLGPPNDERLAEHPLYARGLQYYNFHRIQGLGPTARWIVTFHDETLDIEATSATAFQMRFAATREDAIAEARRGG